MLPDATAPVRAQRPACARAAGCRSIRGERPQVPRRLAELATAILTFGTPPPAPAPGQVHLHLRARQGHVGQAAFLVVGGLVLTGRRATRCRPGGRADARPLHEPMRPPDGEPTRADRRSAPAASERRARPHAAGAVAY